MAWYDIFSDWGTSSWAEDVEAAVDQATSWIDTTAAAKGWSEADEDAAAAVVAAAAGAAGDAGTFWSQLAATWGSRSVDGWSKLQATFSSAADTADEVEAGRDAGSVAEVIGGTVSASAEDVTDSASWLRTWGPWLVGALVVIFVIVLAWRMGK